MTILGSVDTMTETGVTGWAFAPDMREPLTVQAVLDNRILGETVADIHRADLETVGFGNGRCGYVIRFYEQVDPRYLPFVAIKLAHGEVEFPRTPMTGYAEFFTSLYKRYPLSGRSRSVFGGLWTERTDAAAILRGRVEVGTIGTAQEPLLGMFIENGYVRLDAEHKLLRSSPGAVNPIRPMHQAIGVVTDPMILPLLQSILDDQPVALSADTMIEDAVLFRQPSGVEPLASPAECLVLIAAATDRAVHVNIVRGSHRFPEFTAGGTSRYLPGNVAPADQIMAQHMIDTVTVGPGSVTIIGPGTIYALDGAPALQSICVPARLVPANRLAELRAWQASRPDVQTEQRHDHHLGSNLATAY